MKVAVLADTHAPRYWKSCPPEVARRLDGVDLILHAGDVCRATVLEELAAQGHHIPMLLMEYRQLDKLRSTYVDALPTMVNPETGRLLFISETTVKSHVSNLLLKLGVRSRVQAGGDALIRLDLVELLTDEGFFGRSLAEYRAPSRLDAELAPLPDLEPLPTPSLSSALLPLSPSLAGGGHHPEVQFQNLPLE